jgi:arylsulfatase A-like enzyme
MLRVPIIQFPMQDIPDAAAMSPSIAHLPGLPDILRSKGYNTFAAHGGFDYDKFYGLTSRFNEQIASPLQTQSGMIKDYGSLGASIPNALEWLEQHHNEKFFMFIQGFDAHCPFGVPTLNPEFTTGLHSPLDFSRCYWTFDTSKPVLRDGVEYYPVMTDFAGPEGSQSVQLSPDDIEYMKALYDGELATIDRMIGRFFNRLRELDLESKTIVVFLSEHGDMFGKHGRFMRGGPLRGTFYDDVLRIPLVIKNPKDPLVGRRVSQLIESVDITPSLLDMLNIPPPITFRGRSFIPLITDPAAPGRQFVQAASMYTPGVANSLFNQTSVLRAVRNSHYKVISESLWPAEGTDPFQLQPIPSTAPVSEHIQLYDLVEDPNELHDIFQQNQSIAYELLSKSVPIIERNRQDLPK